MTADSDSRAPGIQTSPTPTPAAPFGADPHLSPLREANPNSLSELFSRDPLKLTNDDVDTIATELTRKAREFATFEAQGKRPTGRAPKAAAPSNVSLDDLGL